MSDIDELPNWAVRSVQPGTVGSSNVAAPPAGPPPGRRRGRALVLGLLGLLLIGAVGAGGYWLASRDDDASVATNQSATRTATTAAEDTTGDEVAADATSTTASAATSTTATPASSPAPAGDSTSPFTSDDVVTDPSMVTDDNPIGAVQYAVLSQGKLYLRGKVQSDAVANRIVEVAEAVVGPGNVINEYSTDSTLPVDVPGPLYVEDVVLFGFNSVKVEPAFLPILDLGTLLMTQNPNVTITVVARTDSVGSEETNLEVSRQRAQAVADYWISKGIDPSRVILDPRGEADATDGDDDQAAALDRRAEFIISGIFS